MLTKYKVGKTSDEGYALLVVMGIFAVALLVTALLAAQIMSILTGSTGAKAQLQAEANAEAAVSRAESQLVYPASIADSCAAATNLRTADAATEFKYDETIYWSSSVTQPTLDAQWTVLGCSDTIGYSLSDTIQASNIKFVRIKATGHANNPGTAGFTGFNDRKVDAVFAYKNVLGSAVYSAGDLVGVNGNVTITVGSGATLYVDGLFNCNGTSVTITANVFSRLDATVGGSCTINGDVTSKATATNSGSGNVAGVLTSNSTLPFPVRPNPYIFTPPSYVAGNSNCVAISAAVVANTYFDRSACGTTGTMKALTLALSADAVVYLRNPTNGNPTQDLSVTSSDGQPHRLWLFILSGAAATTEPACTGNKNFVFSTYSVDPKVSALIYDPCQPVYFPTGSTINGQLVTNGVGINGGQTLTVNFSNLNTPGVSSNGAIQAILTQASYRNTN